MPNAVLETTEDERAHVHHLEWLLNDYRDYVDESLFEAFEKIAESQTAIERIDLATSILAKDDTGFAHLVLALENDECETQKHHYEKSIALSKEHDGNLHSRQHVLGYATLQLAKLLWRTQQEEEAIRVLEDADVNNLFVDETLIDEIRFSLVTYLIVQNQDEKAREVLDENGSDTFEWHYLNALLRFRQLGDTSISIGALRAAIGEDNTIGCLISDTEYDGDEDELEDLERWPHDYVDLTRECWNKTSDAMVWLSKNMASVPPRVGIADVVDKSRSSRADKELRLALAHSTRQDFKSAKRSINMALREASRLNDGGFQFYTILGMYGLLVNEFEEAKGPVIELLKQRLTWLDSQAATAEPEALVYSYLDAATALFDHCGDVVGAELPAQKAYDIFDKNRSIVDSQTAITLLTILSSVAFRKSDFAVAESFVRETVSLTEQTFGEMHLRMVGPLQALRYALHNQGKHHEEIEVGKHTYSIDWHADRDEIYEDLEWCEIDKSELIQIVPTLQPSEG